MATRAWLNLGLLLALALLVLLVIREPGREPARDPVPLTGLQVPEIHRVELARGGREDLRLFRAGEQWYLDNDPPLPAQASLVRQLLRLAREPVQRQYDARDLDLERLGLGADAPALQFNDGMELRFGTTDPLDDLRYVQAGDRVYLIRDYYQYLVAGNPDQWISPRLLPEGAAITSLELPALSLRHDEQGQWRIQPEAPDLGGDAIVALVEGWRQAHAQRVTRAGAGAAGELVRIGLEGQGRPVEFQVRQEEADWLFLRPDLGLEYRISAELARRLLQLVPNANATTP